MAVPALEQAPSSQYLAAVERVEEMARLQAQAQRRKSMLVFGPETALAECRGDYEEPPLQ